MRKTTLTRYNKAEIMANFPAGKMAKSARLYKLEGIKQAPSFNVILELLGYKIVQGKVKKGNAFIVNGILSMDRSVYKDSFESLENQYLTDPIYYYNKYSNLAVF